MRAVEGRFDRVKGVEIEDGQELLLDPQDSDTNEGPTARGTFVGVPKIQPLLRVSWTGYFHVA